VKITTKLILHPLSAPSVTQSKFIKNLTTKQQKKPQHQNPKPVPEESKLLAEEVKQQQTLHMFPSPSPEFLYLLILLCTASNNESNDIFSLVFPSLTGKIPFLLTAY